MPLLTEHGTVGQRRRRVPLSLLATWSILALPAVACFGWSWGHVVVVGSSAVVGPGFRGEIRVPYLGVINADGDAFTNRSYGVRTGGSSWGLGGVSGILSDERVIELEFRNRFGFELISRAK